MSNYTPDQQAAVNAVRKAITAAIDKGVSMDALKLVLEHWHAREALRRTNPSALNEIEADMK